MGEDSVDRLPQLICPSHVDESIGSASEDMPDLASDAEDDSEPPSLEMTDDSDGVAEEDMDPAHAGTGSNAHTYSNSGHSSVDGGRLTGQHAAGINRNSRIWHVPDDVDQHQHSLGPAPSHDDDPMHSFPLPTVQFMGPGGGGMVVSVPVPPSLAAITGLPGLSALMGQASSSRQQEPLFLPGGGLGRPVLRHTLAARHNRGHNRDSQHTGSSSSSANRGSGFPSTLDSSHSRRVAVPAHATTGRHSAMVQYQVPSGAATPATRAGAGPPLGTATGSTGSTGAVGFLASGAAALQSAEVFAAAGAGQVPTLLLAQQQPPQQSPGMGGTSAALWQDEAAPRYRPWARGRYMVHARRTRARRTPTQGSASTPAAAAAALGEPFRFAAIPATPAAPAALAQQASAAAGPVAPPTPVQEASTAAAPAGFSQAPQSTTATQLQEDGHHGLAASSSSSTPPQHSRRFRLWPPWCLLASGIRLLHRLVFGDSRSSSAAAATATASITSAGCSAAATAATQSATQPLVPDPRTAASSYPASFSLTIPTETEPSESASPAGAAATDPALSIQHPQLSVSHRRRWQQREAARANRQRRRRQQQPAEDSDDTHFDTCDPLNADGECESSDDGGPEPAAAAATTAAPAWQCSFPQVPGSSVWMAGMRPLASVAHSPAAGATGAAHSPSTAAANSHPTSRPSQPVPKRGRVEAINANSSSTSNAAAAPAPAVATPAAVGRSSTGPSSAAAGAPSHSLQTPVRYNSSLPVPAAGHVSSWQELTPAVGLPERRTAATRLNVGARPVASAAPAACDAAGPSPEQQQQASDILSEGGEGSSDGSSSDSDSCPDLLDGSTTDDLPLAVEPHAVSDTSASPVPSLCSDSSEDERWLLAELDSVFGHSTDDPSRVVGGTRSEHGSELVITPAEQRSDAAGDTITQHGPAGGLCSYASTPDASGSDQQPGSSPPPLLDDPESSVDGSGSDGDDSIPALEVSQEDSTGSEPYSEDDHTSEESGSGDSDHSSQHGLDGIAEDAAGSESGSDDSMPHLEADSEDESATEGQVGTCSTAATAPGEAATSGRDSSRQQGEYDAGISRTRGSGRGRGQSHSSGLRAGFLGGRLEHTTWTTESSQQQQQQQQQQGIGSRPTDGLRSPQRDGGLPAELSPFLQMLHLSAMTYAALGGGTDSEDIDNDEDEDDQDEHVDNDDDDDDRSSKEGSEGGWETASNESGSGVGPTQHHSISANPGAAGSLADVSMREHRQSSRRDGYIWSSAAAVPFGRPRSNAFVVPSSIGREPRPDAVSGQQNNQAGSVVRTLTAATPSVKGLPALERPKATKLLKPSAASEDSSNSRAALLYVSDAEAARKRTARVLRDAAYTRQLLQGLPGVDASNPSIESVLKMLDGKMYTLALAATWSRDGKRLVPYEECAFAQSLERSRIMLSRWHTSY